MSLNLEGKSSLRDWSALKRRLQEEQFQEINFANQVGFASHGALVEPLLANQIHLHTLILRGTGFRDMAALSRGLENNHSLKVLDLSQNPLDDEGVVLLANVLKGHASLESLALNQCHLTSASGRALVEALKTNQVMKRLLCSDNHFDVTIVPAFHELIGTNTTLLELNLQRNSFPEAYLEPIHDILAERKGNIERHLQPYLATLPQKTREHSYVNLESMAYFRLREFHPTPPIFPSQAARHILYLQKICGKIFAGSLCFALLNSVFLGRHVTQLSSVGGVSFFIAECACLALAYLSWDIVRFTQKDYDLSFMGMIAFSWDVMMHEKGLPQERLFVTAKLASLLKRESS